MIASKTASTRIGEGVHSLIASGWRQARGILAAHTDRDRAQRDALAAFAIRIGSAGLLYLSQVALARWMGAADYGVYVVAWTTVLVLGGLSSIGLNLAAIRLVPQYREQCDGARLAGLIRGSRRAAFLVGTAVAAAGLAGLWLLGSRIDGIYVMPAYLALVCIPLYAVTDVQDGIGRGRGWMGLALLPPYVLRPLLVLVAMGIAHLLALPMTAATAVGAAIVATWISGLVQLWAMNQHFAAEIGASTPASDWRPWLGISLPLMATTGAEITLQCADVLILSRSLAPGDVAIYYAAAKTMSLILYVHYAVGSAAANRVAALATRGDKAGLDRAVHEAIAWTFWPSLAAAALVLALGRPLLWLFGPEFAAGYPVMMILVLGFLARSSVGPSDVLLRMLGQHRLSAAISAATAVIAVLLLLVLIPAYGLTGAACATALALVIETGLNWCAAKRRLGLDIGIWQARPRHPGPVTLPPTVADACRPSPA